jgi:uncharacterized protein YjbI with pentapeptide repeats
MGKGIVRLTPAERISLRQTIYGDDLENCQNDTQIPKKSGGISIKDIKSGANLSDKNLIRFNFVENDITDISGANLKQALLYKAILNGVKISDKRKITMLLGAIFDKAELNDAILNNATLKAVKLNKAQMNCAKLNDTYLYLTEMNGAKLVKAELNNSRGLYTKFIDADLTGAELINANLTRPYLTRATLVKADLNGARLDEAVMQSANFQEAWLCDADFRNSIGANSANFEWAYYNDDTKFPPDFDFEAHKMIFVPKDQEEEMYKCFKKSQKEDMK